MQELERALVNHGYQTGREVFADIALCISIAIFVLVLLA